MAWPAPEHRTVRPTPGSIQWRGDWYDGEESLADVSSDDSDSERGRGAVGVGTISSVEMSADADMGTANQEPAQETATAVLPQPVVTDVLSPAAQTSDTQLQASEVAAIHESDNTSAGILPPPVEQNASASSDVESVVEMPALQVDETMPNVLEEECRDGQSMSILQPLEAGELPFKQFKKMSQLLYELMRRVGVLGLGDCGPIAAHSARCNAYQTKMQVQQRHWKTTRKDAVDWLQRTENVNWN